MAAAAVGDPRQIATDKLHPPALRPLCCSHPLCNKAFSSKYKLLRHMSSHSVQKPHQCSFCEKMFHRKDHLKNHLQTHDPNKEAFRCQECGKSYSTKLGYKRHTAMHAAATGDLTCKVCQQRLETTPALLEHLRGHSGGAAGGAKERKHPCAHCERCFYTRKDVRRHMVVHTGRKDFLCQFCAQRFGRKDHLTRHAKKSHSQELLKGKGPPGILGASTPPHNPIKEEELSPVMCHHQPLPGSASYLKMEMESFLLDLQSAPPPAPPSDLPPRPPNEPLCSSNMDVSQLLGFLPFGLPPYSAPLNTVGLASYSASSFSSSSSSSSSSTATSHAPEPLPASLTSLPPRPQGHAFSSHALPRFHQAFQ
ncbi:hypothetical protein AAFF_G00145740 [Aldrovandia affinis]|uniref:C2H2-type domain-containing protein n=1 Tax=Aldrovandia affinis TaxID=143900 RepID=A0AAD7T0S9_9TELE|nr:hypothetical protein AAFF_G00145740 [Aldrovandia affinis]